ncbi:MAG TPA: thermonuclease family protein [Alphaproteobacteria bacterium]|nr:thermonuclease family protein [Alphaproteobacteria bacterium]
MKKILVTMSLVALMHGTAMAQAYAPTPKSAPRTPVNRQSLPGGKPALPPGSTAEGQATIVDAEKLQVNNIDLRLFGVVPPQLSASFGPQARGLLDNLTTGQNVTCQIRDRDQGGRYLATCRNGAGSDLALELLRRGLAVSARGSLASTDLATSYLAAEQAAQTQKLGLWSTLTPQAATLTVQPPKELPKPETPKVADVVIPPAALVDAKTPQESKAVSDAVQAKVSSAAPVAASSLAPSDQDLANIPDDQPGFFARYQLLITGFIMLATALSILFVIGRQRRQERSDELKAMAAALRGELMAARAVCQARLKSETDEKTMSWPRIRSTLYQAYVGRLGWLGAELARQVASIYGQASDYAAYYNTDEEARAESAPKRAALQNLMQHIEEILPRLAAVEQTGSITHAPAFRSLPSPERPVTTTTSMAQEVPAAETHVSHSQPAQLWDSMRKFARERFAEPAHSEEDVDYTALIEEEMSGLSFTEGEDNSAQMPDNVTKMRNTGS